MFLTGCKIGIFGEGIKLHFKSGTLITFGPKPTTA
jgi:hypothetical protein